MNNDSGKAFDLQLFKRLLQRTRPYRTTFVGVAIAAILLSGFAVMTPIILQQIINDAIKQGSSERLLYLTLAMLGVLLGQVISQLGFNYYANWLGRVGN